MDNLDELIEQMLLKAYTRIIYNEDKVLKNIIGDKLSIKELNTLEIIYDNTKSGTNTATNIAKALGITLSTLTINIDRLQAKGYVNRIKHEKDRRIVHLVLTQEGMQIRNKHENLHKKTVNSAIKALSNTEKVALVNALNKLDI